MSKIQSPLLGYNNNVRHKNRVFHIQTEDSGVKHPHVITHLFMDGGRILKSVKRSYGEHLGSDALADTVRQMMKEQHKAMFIALRDGEYDALLDGGAVAAAPAPAPAAVTPQAEEIPRAPETARDRPSEPEPPPSTREPRPVHTSALASATVPSAVPAHALAATRRSNDAAARNGASAREPKAAAAAPAAAARPSPPAPAAPNKPAAAAATRREEPLRREEPAPRSRRYAPARPAAIFGHAQTPNGSIFGEDLVGDKTLDEVILSYLVDDLTPPKKP